ncbi:MAG: hypothetical protein R3F65_01655 [bacterium]
MARLILAGVLVFAALGCKRAPADPVEQVRAAIVALEGAVTGGDVSAVKDGISDAYADPDGRDKGKLVAMLQVRVLQKRRVYVLSRIDEIRITDGGEGATAEVLAAAGAAPIMGAEALANFNADVFRLDLDFERDGDEWLLRSARWRRASRGEFSDEE